MGLILTIALVLAAGGPSTPNIETQSNDAAIRQAQAAINRLESTIRQLQDDNNRIRGELERPFCTAQIESATGIRQFSAPAGADSLVEIGIVSVVSDAPECLPTEITAVATFLDGNQNLICSGIIDRIARQDQGAAVITLTVRPWNTREFIRWRNEPPRTNSGFQILFCQTPDGLTEVAPSDLTEVRSLRLRVIAQPGNGGLASEDFLITPAP